MIHRQTAGLKLASFVQKDEDYCDDLNFLSESEADLIKIDNIFERFEEVSGAILSRSSKSKVMGLGLWKDRILWPLQWLQPKSEIKIFGFQITPQYKTTLESCWDKCYTGFHKLLMSWSSRQLETLIQRVEVLRLFGTSKLWYKASVLPLPVKYAKKFESAMVKFLWVGRLEKLKIDEIKNPYLSGGLNLPCVVSKADTLLLSQVCRMLKNSNSKEYLHMKYWLGLYISEYFPDMGVGPHAEIISPYFQHVKALLVGGLLLGDVKPQALGDVTAKELYKSFMTTFPPPKIIQWKQV